MDFFSKSSLGPHDIDQFFSGPGLKRILGAILVQNVEPNMTLDQLHHQSVQRTPAGRNQLQHFRAIMRSSQGTFDRLHLSAAVANADDSLYYSQV
jgi:hypothetical protein